MPHPESLGTDRATRHGRFGALPIRGVGLCPYWGESVLGDPDVYMVYNRSMMGILDSGPLNSIRLLHHSGRGS